MNLSNVVNKRQELLDLIAVVEKKKYELFLGRFCKMIDIKPEDLNKHNISNVLFDFPSDLTSNKWQISYDITLIYSNDNYKDTSIEHNGSTDASVIPHANTKEIKFTISFGISDKYFINGNTDVFKIYRNSKNKLHTINENYRNDLNIDEQLELINAYIERKNIPEYIALKFFMFIKDNEWDDKGIQIYFSKI